MLLGLLHFYRFILFIYESIFPWLKTINHIRLEDKLTQNEATIEKIKDENKTWV